MVLASPVFVGERNEHIADKIVMVQDLGRPVD